MRVSVPSYHEFIWPTLEVLRAQGGSATNAELLSLVPQSMGLSEAVQEVPHGDGPMSEVAYRLHWARSYLKKDGAATNSERGVWSLTDKGRRMSLAQAQELRRRVRSLGRKPSRAKTDEESDEAGIEPETIDEALGWKDELLGAMRRMPPAAFERLCQQLLREAGFTRVEVTGRLGDGGIDGLGVLRVNLLSFQVLFQCKRYTDAVGPGTVRDFRGAMIGRADKGLILTTGRFTANAIGEALCDLMKDLRLGVKVEMVERVTIEAERLEGF
ncbi:MAG: Mrr restriction system protein [Geminicoccaceae bacterium]|nr:Mrr restriction system protein [Geminicoccaceae bacterium]